MLFITSYVEPEISELISYVEERWGVKLIKIYKEEEVSFSDELFKKPEQILILKGNVYPVFLENIHKRKKCPVLYLSDPLSIAPHLSKGTKLPADIKVIHLPFDKAKTQIALCWENHFPVKPAT